jgi:ubiquitin-protein ligase
MGFFDTPRGRRLRTDAEALRRLKEQSTIFDYQAFGDPPERYLVTFRGRGLMRRSESEPVEPADVHRVEIRLGIDYPRSRPDLQWLTSIYHPNISAVGAVCLGGYSTHWVPSLGLADLCEMLWDMVRYANYDSKSAYNYAAARWCEAQTQYEFPLDGRPLRDRLARTVGDNVIRLEAAPAREAPPIGRAAGDGEDILVIDENTPVPPLPSRPGPSPAPGRDDLLIIE